MRGGRWLVVLVVTLGVSAVGVGLVSRDVDWSAEHTSEPPHVERLEAADATSDPGRSETPGSTWDGITEGVAHAIWTHTEAVAIWEAELDRQAAAAQAVARPAPPSPSYEGTGRCAEGGGSLDAVPPQVVARESGGDYCAVSPPSFCSGRGCFGAYQFDPRTWQSAGCAGDVYDATPAEQDECARRVWDGGRGCSHWAACG